MAHVLGDRRDHFESIDDVWELFRIVLKERKRREIDPTLKLLRESVTELEEHGEEEPFTRERLSEMLLFLETMIGFYEQFIELPTGVLRRLTKIGGEIKKILLQISG